MSTVRPPKVSVTIPVYNGEAHLAETIASVLAQSWGDFELVICDDHSTDGSLDVAAACMDDRIRILRSDRNLGFGGNWNRCLAAAQGKYIKILPQDDLLHPDCLHRQAEVLDNDAHGEVALVFCSRGIVGPSGRSHLTRRLAARAKRYTGAGVAKLTARMGTNPIGEPGAVLFRHTAAQAAGAFGIRIYAIGVGSEGMAAVPVGRGLFGLRYENRPVKIDEALLTEIATNTGGRYFRAKDAQALQSIYEQIDALERSIVEARAYIRYTERFRWPLLLGLAALLGELALRARRGVLP